MKYTPINFIEDLREELEKNKSKHITDSNLSIFLGKKADYIRKLKKNFRRNPRFQISHQDIKRLKETLKVSFKKHYFKFLKIVIKYKSNNILKFGSSKIYENHPFFKENYFEQIDSVEKAYWLGYIYADGSLRYVGGVSKKGVRYARFEFSQSPIHHDNIKIVNQFAQTLKINRCNVNILKNGNYGFYFSNIKFSNDLIKWGMFVGKQKSKEIRYPLFLKNKNFELAFLLGFFDGDGIKNTTQIELSNKDILIDIKERFRIPYNVKKTSHGWRLALGATLFNEMMELEFKNSLQRKRRYFKTNYNKNIREKSWKEYKFMLKKHRDYSAMLNVTSVAPHPGQAKSSSGKSSKSNS